MQNPKKIVNRPLLGQWIALLFLGLAFAGGLAQAQQWGPKYAQPFTLTDHQGRTISNYSFTGRWSLVFFGYTHCPDVCPLTLQVIKDVHGQLKGHPIEDQLQYVFVSIDPDRDTPSTLARYVGYFGDFLLGVTGKTDDIEKLVVACGAHYEFDDPDEKGNYTISHTASIALIGPDGQLAGVYPEPHNAVGMSQSLMQVVRNAKDLSRQNK